MSSNPTPPSTPDDDALDWIFGKPEDDAIVLAARQDHLCLLAHSACSELLELVRLRDKLVERGGKIVPLDCFPWIDSIEALETARRRYAHELKHYDGPAIIREAATSFAGPKIAQVIEDVMTSWRERIMAEASAALERERAAAPPSEEG